MTLQPSRVSNSYPPSSIPHPPSSIPHSPPQFQLLERIRYLHHGFTDSPPLPQHSRRNLHEVTTTKACPIPNFPSTATRSPAPAAQLLERIRYLHHGVMEPPRPHYPSSKFITTNSYQARHGVVAFAAAYPQTSADHPGACWSWPKLSSASTRFRNPGSHGSYGFTDSYYGYYAIRYDSVTFLMRLGITIQFQLFTLECLMSELLKEWSNR